MSCVWQLCAPPSLAEVVGVWLGLGAFLLLALLCSCVLLPWQCCCAVIHHLLLWHLWELHAALMLLECCRGATVVVDGTWGAEQGQTQQPLLGLVPWLS